ncbi:hypothetical protein VTN49DRAFT_3376 [Thermomyces lanuginosus]|uniref:uncharacterized protein n=1 Tax=Thermomyces lanuginosus TaxID=5541 RepID=UPI0037432F59
MAGTGKSTIAITVAKRFNAKGLLAASFFFKRGEEDRGNAKKLFSTLAKQLANKFPQLAASIGKAIDNDPDISEKVSSEQFDKLILRPLVETGLNHKVRMVIVIDALDECEESDVKVVLRMLPRVQQSHSLRLRFLLTSRPELAIRSGFRSESVLYDNHQDFILHEIPKPVIERDISLYFNIRFSELRDERSLPPDWPGQETIQVLVERAVPLFIFAVTLYRFISEGRRNPARRLEAILADQTTYTSKMDGTYMPVLNQLLAGQDEEESQQFIREFKETVGVIILLYSPLSKRALASLLNVDTNEIENRLMFLHSVLNIPHDSDTPVRMLHLSFRDFLLDPKKKDTNPFWIDEKDMHAFVFHQSLGVMKRNLRKNICQLNSYGTRRNEVDDDRINEHLPPEVRIP